MAWVDEITEIDSEHAATYRRLRSILYPNALEYREWSDTAFDEAADLRLAIPPQAAKDYHEARIDIAALIGEQTSAFAEGNYAYGNALIPRIQALQSESERHLDAANNACAAQ